MDPAEHTAVTIVRLKFKQEGSSIPRRRPPEWHAAMGRLRQVDNWRYVSTCEGVDDAAEVALFIGWTDNKPPPAFRTSAALIADIEQGTNALVPLQPLFDADPQVLIFRCEKSRISPESFSLAGGTDHSYKMREFITIRGPRDVLEPVVQSITRALFKFCVSREGARIDEVGPPNEAFQGCFNGWIEESEEDEGGGPGKKEQQKQQRCFVLIPTWASREARAEFQDPTIGDKTLPRHLKEYFGLDFWEKTVAAPLRKLEAENGVVVTSWDYHHAGLAKDEKGLMTRFKNDY